MKQIQHSSKSHKKSERGKQRRKSKQVDLKVYTANLQKYGYSFLNDRVIIKEDDKFNKFMSEKKISKIKKIRYKKLENYFYENTNITIKKIIYFLNLLMLFDLFIQTLLFKNQFLIKFSLSKIRMKIKGIGRKYFLTPCLDKLINYPNRLSINDIPQDPNIKQYNFNKDTNIVYMEWDDKINFCGQMFCGCKDIIEIDLSDFDTSEVTTMSQMFTGCSSLISVTLSNSATSKVSDMHRMFDKCSSLTYLDLNNFHPSKSCIIHNMFNGCSSLTYLNLNNFDSIKVSSSSYMFKDCNK